MDHGAPLFRARTATNAFFTTRAGWGSPVADPPVLVLGASRSGKSLLANLLGAHPALANLDERRELGEAFTRHGEALLGAASEAADRVAASPGAPR